MALRLRRGTDAQRLLITPLEGELIYTTDTQEIYVGDGVTAGGIRVTGLVPENIEDLQNVSSSVPGDNDVLIWSAIDAQWVPIPLDTIAPGSTLASMADVDITDPVDNQILSYDSATSSWTNTAIVTTDIKGSVFADDSTLVVDGLTGQIHADAIFTRNNSIDLFPATGGTNTLKVVSDGDRSILRLTREQDTALGVNDQSGAILFEKVENGTPEVNSVIFSRETGLFFGNDSDGLLNNERFYFVWQNGQFGIGTGAPTAKLDVAGDANIQGTITAASFNGSVVADDSTTIIDGLTGTVSTSRIQTVANQVDIIPDVVGISNEVSVISDAERSILRLVREDDFLVNENDQTGAIFFEKNDSEGNLVNSVIFGRENGLYFGNDSTGNLQKESSYFVWRNGNLGVGLGAPIAKLDVAGDANIRGDLTANAIKGTFVGDDSTIIIDGLTGTITADIINANNIYTDIATNKIEVLPSTTGDNEIRVISNDDRSILRLTRSSAADLTGNTSAQYGSIFFERDDANGPLVTSVILGRENGILFGNASDGNLTTGDKYFVWQDGKLGVGQGTPVWELDVAGDIKATKSIIPGVYADATARDADITAPTEGMMVFLQDTQKMTAYVSDTGLAAGGVANATAGWYNMY